MATNDALEQYEQTRQNKQKIEKNKKERSKNVATISKLNSSIKSLDERIASTEQERLRERAAAAKIITDWEAIHGQGNTDWGSITQGYIDGHLNNAKYYADARDGLKKQKKEKIAERDKLTAANKKLWAAYRTLTGNPPPGDNKDDDGTKGSEEQTTKLSTTTDRGGYIFNAPMVKNASTARPKETLQQLMARGYNISEGHKDDAFYFWKNGAGGRGAIQMDRKSYTPENLKANKAKFIDPAEFDDSLYGYKFHYNPTAVTMTWGAVDGVDPYFAASDSNPSIPVAQNLLQSYIDFSFYINRIEDFNYLDYQGLRSKVDTTGFVGMDPAERNAAYRAAYEVLNPYPETVGIEDLQAIYKKGTMYDVDWLMKVMHGGTGFVNYKSTLMGITSDIGWLPYRVLEVHLGDSLRYRARVASLTVDHLIFNSRMVPVLSKVTMTMARYWDGPASKEQPKK